MIRTIWLFNDKEQEAYIKESFLPLLHALPGAEGIAMLRVVASAMGEFPAQLMVEARFATEDAMNEAFASPEGRRISREIMESSGQGMEMVTLESDPGDA
ncbi:EthD family reductase [bacterium]|nr:EthD family reductase [bacterium]